MSQTPAICQWRIYEIVADVPEDAGVISYGLFLAGIGTGWLDDVTVDALEIASPNSSSSTAPLTGSSATDAPHRGGVADGEDARMLRHRM